MAGGLVLARYPGEQVHLFTEDGKEIVVKVLRLNGRQVSLLFDADESVQIVREELLDES